MVLTVAEIARKLGADFEGDGDCQITGLAGLLEARAGDISFLSNPRYATAAADTQASAVVVSLDWARPSKASALIRAGNPDKAFAQIAEWFTPPAVEHPAGIHPAAVVSPDTNIAKSASIGPLCVIEPGVSVGDRTVISAGCYLGHDVAIGQDSKLYPHVTVRERCQIGNRVIVHNGTVIGSDGFGYTVDGKGVRHKIPQIGIVVIGDDVEIGANVTIDRARFGKTRIGNGVKIDNLVQIAHNVVIGDNTVIVAQVGIAGSAHVGARVIVAGQAGVGGHITVGDGAIIAGQAGATKDVPPNDVVVGFPAVSRREFAQHQANVAHLPALREKVAELEKRIKELEAGQKS